jgi:hypothetical protein
MPETTSRPYMRTQCGRIHSEGVYPRYVTGVLPRYPSME